MSKIDFDIAVFAVNEAATIGACVASIDRACAAHSAHISVLLNGTTDDTVEVLKSVVLTNAVMTIYRFPIADKANAINHFLYHLRRDAAVHIAIDAYTRIGEPSFRAILATFAAQPQALIASGLPISGRSAETVAVNTMKGGMVNGQLYALRPNFVTRLVTARYRLPLQIYRGDPLIGSMAAHNLDAMGEPWNSARLIGVPDASFAITPLSIFKPRDIKRQYTREVRQARGRMENAAIKAIIYKHGYAGLPENANDMIRNWLRDNQPAMRSLRERYFTKRALDHLAQSQTLVSRKPTVIAYSSP